MPVLTGVAECTTALACRFAADAQRVGVDGLMVLPAMVYKSDPRETMAHFRAVAAATDLPIMVYNNPVSYDVDITPEMFAELADEPKFVAHQGIVGERPADHRPEERLRRPLHPLLRRGRPGARKPAARARSAGSRGWSTPSRPRTACSGTWPRRGWDEAREGLPLVHAAAAPRHAREARAVHQARGAGMRPRLRDGPRPAAARGGEERERILAIIRRGIATRPKIPDSPSKNCPDSQGEKHWMRNEPSNAWQ